MTVTPLKVKFGALLKENLNAAGKRQKEMAELLGISSAAISQVLHGKNTFSKRQLDAVIEWLKLNRTQSAQLSSVLNQIRNGETQLLSPFNRFLFSLRSERGFSIPQLADKSGISYARLMELEKSNEAKPAYDEAVSLSLHLKCSVADLLRCSGSHLTEIQSLGDPDQVSQVCVGVADSSTPWNNTPIPMIALNTLADYDPQRGLLEYSCQKAHRLLLKKNKWYGIPVIAAECDAMDLTLRFPGRARLIIGTQRPTNYNQFDLCFTKNGTFFLRQQIGFKQQVFRSAGFTADNAPILWTLPVLELKLLPTYDPEEEI
ncbi:MAG: helix-turn-helix transcriptional regulator [Lentisphaeria bacterium]|nr:helix-turn-helix transcriptional regulator [Lentisphaeria bacterium]